MKYPARFMIFIFTVWLSVSNVIAQFQTGTSCRDGLDSLENQPVLKLVDTLPEYDGGMVLFYKMIRENLFIPDSIEHIDTRFFISFTIDTKGNISDVCYVKPAYEFIKHEMWESMNTQRKWKPGSHGGQVVPVRMILPMYIELK